MTNTAPNGTAPSGVFPLGAGGAAQLGPSAPELPEGSTEPALPTLDASFAPHTTHATQIADLNLWLFGACRDGFASLIPEKSKRCLRFLLLGWSGPPIGVLRDVLNIHPSSQIFPPSSQIFPVATSCDFTRKDFF